MTEMGFGASVSALLETYDNCLSLLKAFKRQKKQDGGRRISKPSDQQALLKHSLKTDRRKVERSYASRVSGSGSRFAHGDAKAKSALSKVLKRLNAAIAGLMRMASKSSNPAVDYQSLMSLSNSSRIQAIKAFDSLSHRLNSKSSRSSVGSATTSKSSKSSKSSRTSKSSRSKDSGSGASSASKSTKESKDSKHRRRTKISKREEHEDKRVVEVDNRRQDETPSTSRLDTSIPTPLLDAMERRDSDGPLRRRPSMMNRFSLISISSGSTKLGEVPERKWCRKYDDWDGDSDEYNAPIVYPLRPYQPVVKERRFLGLFRRGN